MRVPLAIVLLAFWCAAEEPERTPGKAPEHDLLGFPIIFNGEVITRGDVLRSLGGRPSGPMGLRNERDRVLNERVIERVGQLHGIVVEDRDVDDDIRSQIGLLKGEAKFYEWLAQRGQTLESYKESVRLRRLQQSLDAMLSRGYTPARKLLPWSPIPTPRELEIAYRNDAGERSKSGARVRHVDLEIDLDDEVRKDLVRRKLDQEWSDERFEAEVKKKLEPVLDRVMSELKAKKSIDEIAADPAVSFEAQQRRRWVTLPREPGRDAATRFLQSSRNGDFSQPLKRSGGYVIVYVLEIQRVSADGLTDPAVYREYKQRIRRLRRDKAEFRLKLEALDSSSVQPPRVRDEFRAWLLASLKEADAQLRGLGLH